MLEIENASSSFKGRIAGGQTAWKGQFPYQVSLRSALVKRFVKVKDCAECVNRIIWFSAISAAVLLLLIGGSDQLVSFEGDLIRFFWKEILLRNFIKIKITSQLLEQLPDGLFPQVCWFLLKKIPQLNLRRFSALHTKSACSKCHCYCGCRIRTYRWWYYETFTAC